MLYCQGIIDRIEAHAFYRAVAVILIPARNTMTGVYPLNGSVHEPYTDLGEPVYEGDVIDMIMDRQNNIHRIDVNVIQTNKRRREAHELRERVLAEKNRQNKKETTNKGDDASC